MNNQQIAQTIIAQLGGNKFLTMVGQSGRLIYGNDSLGNPFIEFKFKGCKKANRCKISLTLGDTYKIKFFKIANMNCDLVHETNGAYCDMLRDIFEDFTGLATSLGF